MNEMRYLHAQMRRSLQTAGYLAAITSLLLLSGWLLLGTLGILVMLSLALGTLLASSQLPLPVLMRMKGARRLARGDGDWLVQMVRELSARAGLTEPPTVYVVPTRETQAFAASSGGLTGIAVTPSLVRHLTPDELEGVLAHEISHLASGDTKVMGAAGAMRQLTRSLATLAWLLLLLSLLSFGAIEVSLGATALLLVAPALSSLAELGLSRTREFSADLAAARLTSRPESLARALLKLEAQHGGVLQRLLGPQIVLTIPEALRTHPSTAERVRRLLDLKSTPPQHRLEPPFPAPGFRYRQVAQRPAAFAPAGALSPGRSKRWSVTIV